MRSLGALVRFWFTFQQAVTRRAYLLHGLALMALKYGVDVVLVWVASATLWTPLDYLQSIPLLLSSRLSDSAVYLSTALAIWTLPFLWIGISMTMRRLLDAGWSAWWSLLFFVPLISYGLLATLTLAPTSARRTWEARADPDGDRLPSALLSIAIVRS